MSIVNKIASFAVLDLETTGLPGRDFDKANITEIAIHVIAAEEIRNAINCDIPRINHKLQLVFNPEMVIHPIAVQITGLNNSLLKEESSFDSNAGNIIINFLQRLRQPVCLVAHNGNRFDFPVLKHALHKLGMELPTNIMCIDTLGAIKELDKVADGKAGGQVKEENSLNDQKIESPNQVVKTRKQIKLYKLEIIYFRCFGVSPEGAHNAEADVVSLEKIMLHYGKSFVEYAEVKAKPFKDI